MDLLLLMCLAITFFATLLFTNWWIKRAEKAGIVGIDMHKLSKKKIAEMGGLPVMLGFFLGVLLYIGHRTFFQHNSDYNMNICLLYTSPSPRD